jgi:23S rRNA pseudouridine2605 synthase
MQVRVQKIIAEMGIASRRQADEMVAEGRVIVNGKKAIPGTKADPAKDHIKLDGKLLTGRREGKVYFMMNKPVNVMTTLEDPEGRPTIRDFLKKVKQRVYPVGRLDFDSEGLLLLTNDGELAHGIMHPSKKVPKTYRVKVKGVLDDKEIERLRKGVFIEGGKTAPAKIRKLRMLKENSWLEVIITEGRKRQVRRMLDGVGHSVIRLIRTRIGRLDMGRLGPGEVRRLERQELEALRAQAGLAAPKKRYKEAS